MRNTSILFYGEGNLLEHALNKAAQMLNTDRESLSTNPDYLYVDYDEGKTSIGVETANEIVNKSALVASFNEYQVCVVNHMDSMTEAAQNKLLKTLEESALIILGVCYENTLLPTVKSRMKKVHISDKAQLSDEVTAIFDKVLVALDDKPEELLLCLNLVKEKDTSSFYQQYRNSVGDLLSLIGNHCSSKLSEETVKRLGKQREYCMSSNFTKDDFFVLIATVVNDLKKGVINVTV